METYFTKAIVLNRVTWREDSARVIVYSKEKGKLDLVARGAKKAASKLAAHLEPITLSNLMVVRGRQYNYAGAAVSENCYLNIKNDLEKLETAGKIVNIFNKLVKENEKDERLFELLGDALGVMNVATEHCSVATDLLVNFFTLKLLALSGHKPELYHCVVCYKRITPANNIFNLAKGGVACGKCMLLASLGPTTNGAHANLTISDDCIKVLRLTIEEDFKKLIKFKMDKSLKEGVVSIISSFLKYHHGF